ncbi:restriction endonuclease [Bradyrhizobium sacchari]|uniref:5-methylcytosine-specific restriction enzyme subunit McrC n=1 Tax=Bradyrhizobium sacchari TaxID=1399419 RepID=A0A560JCJ7_9BRAD|nr:restriction endonuclease [Bradyrhizobium sacchari]OPY93574.1 restriction endonuclease [Bradyrhizobium sacchari]TWB50890.1 5-methylcytosine-specific restriction enzyme subunit McrC [Bradyrhizobium sacchari]TWB68902.1 5-methylcytosine-specific restriction enzyme subunit McrC [Bradyrhizobium sacchari]
MIHRTIKEWDYLEIEPASDGPRAFTRSVADGVMKVARSVKFGGDGEGRVLLESMSRLRAQQVVGVLVAKDATLEILPKIEGVREDRAIRRSLVNMLASVIDLNIAVGKVANLGWQNENLLEILIRLFSEKLFATLRQGMPRAYIGREDDVSALRGRLDVVRQFTILASTPQRLACRFDELSSNIALNQIMKATLARLLQVSRNSENRRRLRELTFVYEEVESVPIRSLRWDRVVLDRTNVGWTELLRFAKLLLQDRYQSTTSGTSHGFSLLFEMNKLFEEFVGRSLRRALQGTGLTVHLQGPRRYALVDRQSGGLRFATRPDIVISQNGRPLLVIDTKWKRLKEATDDPKRGVSQSDVYQMMAYAHVYDCDRLMLLYPHHHELADREGLVAVHQIANKSDSLIGIATVDLVKPEFVGKRLKEILLGDERRFDLTSKRTQIEQHIVSVQG